jgi:heme A synthase/MoxR-like ATPase
VPDWPTSYGGFNPPRWWQIDTVRAEHGHRLIAGTVALLTLALAVWAQRREPRRWVRRLAWTAFAAVVAQALLGGLTVLLFLPPAVSISHAALAQAFLCLVVAVAVVTSPRWRPVGEGGTSGREGDAALRRLATAATALVYLQILAGAVMRHLGAGLAIPTFPDVFGGLVPPRFTFAIGIHYAHRVGALLVALVVAAVAARVFARHRGRPALVVPAVAMLAVTAAQITLGALVVLSGKAVVPNTAHVATGAVLLSACLVLALETWRGARAAAAAAGAPAALPRVAEDDATLLARFPKIVARCPKMLELFRLVLKIAPTDATILIHGESGTGKELIARSIHDLSPRHGGPYVAENCAAFPETLLESELFGHSKGAFTGADRTRKGRFQMAHKGTLFLDEVGDMSSGLQKKLLRALQEGEIRPVGSSAAIKVDVRFISASNKDLAEMVKKGTFREDLFFRLSPIRIELPPLRERGNDLLLLTERLAAEAARRCGRAAVPDFASETLAAMLRYRWPGNVRELQNEVQRAIALADAGRAIELKDLSPEIQAAVRR